MKAREPTKVELPLPRNDEEMLGMVHAFPSAVARAISATAALDSIITVDEYRAAAESATQLDAMSSRPNPMSALILYYLATPASYTAAMQQLRKASEDISLDERAGVFSAVEPLIRLQVQRKPDVLHAWESALGIQATAKTDCKRRSKNIPLKRPEGPVAAVQKCTAGEAPILELCEATGSEGNGTELSATT